MFDLLYFKLICIKYNLVFYVMNIIIGIKNCSTLKSASGVYRLLTCVLLDEV